MGRDSVTPMEFEWDNKTGPIDNRSPFVVGGLPPKKRPHSVLETPNKSALGAFNTPDRPRLREPHSEHVLFSQKPPSAVPAHVRENAWEPRTPASVTTDFSSGGETPNTPAQDSDISTPGTHLIDKMGRLNTEEARTKSPKKSKRESFMQLFKGSPSPTKEKDSRRGYSSKAENRVMKRRSKSRKVAARDGYDSDDTHVGAPGRPKGAEEEGYIKQAGNFFHWVEAHPHLPSVMTTWLQFAVNTVFIFICGFILYSVWQGVLADINIEIAKYEAKTMRENISCGREYTAHNCDTPTHYLEAQCGEWNECMNRDAKAVAKASVTARTFARIFNAFVGEFSTKAMIFTFLVLFGSFNLSNWAFSALRSRNQQDQYHQFQQHQQQFLLQQQQQQQQQPPPQQTLSYQAEFYPPATPHRYPSAGYLDQTPFQTPYATMGGVGSKSLPALPALPAPGEDSLDGEGKDGGKRRSPTKRRLFA